MDTKEAPIILRLVTRRRVLCWAGRQHRYSREKETGGAETENFPTIIGGTISDADLMVDTIAFTKN